MHNCNQFSADVLDTRFAPARETMQIGANGYFKAHPSPALWRSIGSGFLHSYTCAFQRIAASIRPRFDPFIEALLQAEDEAKRWKRDLDRAETELIEAVRSIR